MDFVGFSSGFSGFLNSSFALSLSGVSLSSCPFLSVPIELYECTGDSCEDCDRLLSLIPSGVCRVSCSEDRRNLFKLSLRTSECDFFFFLVFRVAAETVSMDDGFCSLSWSSRCCDRCRGISEVEEDRESRKITRFLIFWYTQAKSTLLQDVLEL